MDVAEKTRKNIYKQNMETLENSTIHGVATLLKSPHTIIKIMWTICILASGSYCTYAIYTCFVQYFDYATVTQADVEYVNELEFPLIKICHADFGVPIDFPLKDKVSVIITSNFYQNKYANDNLAAQKTVGIKSLNDALITCIYNLNGCNVTRDFRYFFDFNYGSCYQFNSGFNMNGEPEPIKKCAQPGPLNGLQLEFYVGQASENDNAFTYNNGLNILISNETLDSTARNGLVVSPGFSTHIVVNKYSITLQPTPYSTCIGHLESPNAYPSTAYKLTYNFNKMLSKPYHYRDCFYTCFQKYMGDMCKCQDSLYVAYYPDMAKCLDMSALNCFQKAYASFTEDNSHINACDCPLECERIDYTISSSYSEYPTLYYSNILATNPVIKSKFASTNMTYEALKESVAAVFIYYDKLQEIKISHDIKMSASDLLGMIGGNLGLFLGLSLLTFIEFVEMFVQTGIIFYKDKMRKTRQDTSGFSNDQYNNDGNKFSPKHQVDIYYLDA